MVVRTKLQYVMWVVNGDFRLHWTTLLIDKHSTDKEATEDSQFCTHCILPIFPFLLSLLAFMDENGVLCLDI